MSISWDDETEKLRFEIHLKPGQGLKYLNLGSEHPHSCFQAILWGVFYRACKLTSKTKENLERRIDKIYPLYAEGLRKVNLTTNFPTMGKFLKEIETKNKKRTEKYIVSCTNKFLEDNNPPDNKQIITRKKIIGKPISALDSWTFGSVIQSM